MLVWEHFSSQDRLHATEIDCEYFTGEKKCMHEESLCISCMFVIFPMH